MWGNVKSFPTQNSHKMTAKEQTQRIKDIAREKGWSVSIDDKSQSNVLFEFQRFTKYGQDFLFNADMHGGDIDNLIAGIKEGLLEFGVMGIANGILTIYTPYV